MDKVDLRLMLLFGFLTFATGSWQLTYITKDYDFWELFVPQILRGVGLMFAMVPVTNLALGTLAPDRLKNASSLFNLARNLGGAVGLAILNTLLNHRIDLHLDSVARSRYRGARGVAVETLADMTSRFSGLRFRRAIDGAQANDAVYPPAGDGDGVRRRVSGCRGTVCRIRCDGGCRCGAQRLLPAVVWVTSG